MSEDNKKDSQNMPYFDPLYSPNELEEKEKNVEERLAESIESYREEIMNNLLTNPVGINRPIYASPQIINPAAISSTVYIRDKLTNLEKEISRLNADIIQLKNIILILKTELQDLKK